MICQECLQLNKNTECFCKNNILGTRYIGLAKGCVKDINGKRCRNECKERKIEGYKYTTHTCEEHSTEQAPKNFVEFLNPRRKTKSPKN